MAWPRRLFVVLLAGTGGLGGSQFPEYSQQYWQRLGGAVDELHEVVAGFDADARAHGLSREEALMTYGRSIEPFLQERGLTMAGLLERYERLVRHRAELAAAHPVERPLLILFSPDPRIAAGAWRDFEPGVPASGAGAAWAGLGVVLAGLAAWAVVWGLRGLMLAVRRLARPGAAR